MLDVTAITFGRALLKIVEYVTLYEAQLLGGFHVYDHSPTPVLNESFCPKFDIVLLLTVASR